MNELPLLLEEIDLIQQRCTRCGLCLEVCPRYQAKGWEQESPRGTIHLAQEMIHGRIDPRSADLRLFEECQGCRACEKSCPLDVPIPHLHSLVLDVRDKLKKPVKKSVFQYFRELFGQLFRCGR